MQKPEQTWDARLETESWHTIEGPDGMCACGNEKGNCRDRLKSFITKAIQEAKYEGGQVVLEAVLKPDHHTELVEAARKAADSLKPKG